MRMSVFLLRVSGSIGEGACPFPAEAGMWRSASGSRHPMAAGREG